MEIVNWVVANVGNIIFAATAVVTAASVIVQMTPTQKDDNLVAKVQKVLNFLAINWGNDHGAK